MSNLPQLGDVVLLNLHDADTPYGIALYGGPLRFVESDLTNARIRMDNLAKALSVDAWRTEPDGSYSCVKRFRPEVHPAA